jgi:hypothetical protein
MADPRPKTDGSLLCFTPIKASTSPACSLFCYLCVRHFRVTSRSRRYNGAALTIFRDTVDPVASPKRDPAAGTRTEDVLANKPC